MSDNSDSGGMSAMVAIIAILAIVAIGYVVLQVLPAADDNGSSINIDLPGGNNGQEQQ